MNRVLKGLYDGGPESWRIAGSTLSHTQALYIEELTQWHATLPPQLAFVDFLPLRDEREFLCRPSNELSLFLQTRYVGVLEWIYRPSLYIILDGCDVTKYGSELALMALKAVDCGVALILLVATHHRHGGIWGLVRRSFGAALLLIAVAVHNHRLSRQKEPNAVHLDISSDWVQIVELSMMTIRRWGGSDAPDLVRMVNILKTLLESALAEMSSV